MTTPQEFYLAKGWPIFPCGLDKKPLTPTGFKEATTDRQIVRAWWQVYGDASIGAPTGSSGIGLWVLDVDLPDGPTTLANLEERYGKLPVTLEQKTGGGGRQLFFKLPIDGRTIRNSAGKIGVGLDTRGDGGYVILAPSGHPSGGKYQWIYPSGKRQLTEPVDAPAWLLDLVCSKPERKNPERHPGQSTAYGVTALAYELAALAGAGNGTRNSTLNTCAFTLGQLVSGGELDQTQAEAALLGVALSIGLGEAEARKTISSGMRKGQESPRAAPDRVSNVSNVISVSGCQQMSADVSNCQQMSADGSGCQQMSAKDHRDFPGNLAAEIKDWVANSSGSFTCLDVDREFGLSTRADKNNRSKILTRLVEEGRIRKDKSIKSKYHAIDQSFETINLDEVEEKNFDINLPLGLSSMVRIPPKSVVVVAGTSNSGKTALLLNIAHLNLDRRPFYLMSEMGGSEYKQRLGLFGHGLGLWKAMTAAMKVSGQEAVIQQHNPDGLTIIDFLEEVDGEYYKISSSIRAMYDALGEGVAIIAIQKRSGQEHGRGGEATAEKARLYLTLDTLVHTPRCTVCSLKIIKAKIFDIDQGNPNGKEIHFKLLNGHLIEPLTGWMYVNDAQRKAMVANYERTMRPPTVDDLPF